MEESISIPNLKKLLVMDPNIKIIDIRENYIYNLGSIPRAKNVALKFLMAMPEEYLDKDQPYYVCCEYGEQSREVCKRLNALGYHMISIDGGYHDYMIG